MESLEFGGEFFGTKHSPRNFFFFLQNKKESRQVYLTVLCGHVTPADHDRHVACRHTIDADRSRQRPDVWALHARRTAGTVADVRAFGSERAPCQSVTSTVYVTWFHESSTVPHAKEY